MATYDGSRSLEMGCDEIYDHECGPCSAGGTKQEAKNYCIECQDYLCDACKNYHGNLSAIKNHNIVSGSKIPASASGMPGLVSPIVCGCSRYQPVEFYCEIHKDVVCSPCKSFHHHKCKTSSIKQKSSGYRSSTVDSVLSQTQSLKDKYDRLKQEFIRCDKEVKQLKEALKKEIKSFRKALDTFLDNLEKNMLTELDKWESAESRRVDQHISDLTTALKVVESDCKLLEDAKRDGRKEMMFTADIRVSSALQGYEDKLGELEKNVDKPFERNQTIADLITDIKSLGFLKTQSKSNDRDNMPLKSGISRNEILRCRKVKSRSKVNVKTVGDKEKPWITGCTVMPNGHVVLCDQRNEKIKLLSDKSTSIVESLEFSSPWDVSVLDTNTVVITSLGNMQLHYVQVFPQMKAGRFIQLDKRCFGVEVSGDKIYITCHNNPGEGEVRVFDLTGKLQKRLGNGQDETFMFARPYYCTVNTSGEKIFVSDWDTNTVVCMTVNGRIIYKYKDDDMDWPRGLYCDSEDNLLVCGYGSHNVQIITADGKKDRTLLSSKDGLYFPFTIAYRATDDTLIVGGFNTLLLLKLTK